MYRRILIALEGKETDEPVLAHVQKLAAQMQAEVTLLWVITIADDNDGTGLGRQWQLEIGSNGWRQKNQAVAYLAQLERRLRREGLHVETALVPGAGLDNDVVGGQVHPNLERASSGQAHRVRGETRGGHVEADVPPLRMGHSVDSRDDAYRVRIEVQRGAS